MLTQPDLVDEFRGGLHHLGWRTSGIDAKNHGDEPSNDGRVAVSYEKDVPIQELSVQPDLALATLYLVLVGPVLFRESGEISS